jgi:hypothetical protein
MVTFGPGGYTATRGRKVKESEDDGNNYMGLVRKPKLSSQDSYKPSWPTTKIIPPMMLHKVDQYDTVDSSGGGSNDDALLRRPTAVPDHNVSSTSKPSLQGTSEISSKMKNVSLKLASVAPLRKPSVGLPATGVGSMMSPPVIEEEEGRVQGSEMSEERFTRLLELASSPNDSRDQVYYLFPVCLHLSLCLSACISICFKTCCTNCQELLLKVVVTVDHA